MKEQREHLNPENATHSFVIKIWLEEAPEEGHEGQWRGRVTHVGKGEHVYVKSLEDITGQIAPYLKAWGIER